MLVKAVRVLVRTMRELVESIKGPEKSGFDG